MHINYVSSLQWTASAPGQDVIPRSKVMCSAGFAQVKFAQVIEPVHMARYDERGACADFFVQNCVIDTPLSLAAVMVFS